MKRRLHLLALICGGLVISALAADTTTAPKESAFPSKPLGITLSVKMVGPYMEPADLQIICLFKFAEQFLAAYDTENRLQAQGLAPEFSIESLVIEAGPTFFDSAVKEVGNGIDSVTAELAKRDSTSYNATTK